LDERTLIISVTLCREPKIIIGTEIIKELQKHYIVAAIIL